MAAPYFRVSLQGSLPGGEVWSVNPCFNAVVATDAGTQEWADNIVQASNFLYGNLKDTLSTGATLDKVVVGAYDTADEKLQFQSEAAWETAITGTGGMSCPATTAVVLSLYTSQQSRSGRGRLYWPALALSLVSTTGRITPATTAGLAAGGVNLLTTIESLAPASANARAIVRSRTTHASWEVTSVRVGDVPDSLRGRKNALNEARTIAPMPA